MIDTPGAFFQHCLTLLGGVAVAEGPGERDARAGTVTLHPHQVEGMHRLLAILARHGGALLADEVGLGKTYTALAVARRHASVLVVAPAAVRELWREAGRRCQAEITVVSYEQLSAGNVPRAAGWDLVILDEAHRARSPATRRYRALTHLTRGVRVLLLTATPIHNRRADLDALLALFLGAGAATLDDASLGALVVRHRVGDVGVRLPALGATVRHDVPPAPAVLAALRALPPPLPPADGGVAESLVVLQLTRAWCSSDAALLTAIQRRLATATALEHALTCGRLPDRRDLVAWAAADDGSVQLAFPQLMAAPAPAPDTAPLLDLVRRHAEGLRAVRTLVRGAASRDDARFGRMCAVLASCGDRQAVVFTHSAETAEAAYRALRATTRVALLTGRGACIASGPVTRQELLAAFAPGGRTSRDDIARVDVLVASDVLSEGVDLQGAAVVLHLDLPWTVARFEQRLGRLRRMGSPHDAVESHLVAPPVDADELALTLHHLARKARLVLDTVGHSSILLGAEAWGDVSVRSNARAPLAARHLLLDLLRRLARAVCEGPPPGMEAARDARAARGAKAALDDRRDPNADHDTPLLRWHVHGLSAPQSLAIVSVGRDPQLVSASAAGVTIAPDEVVPQLEALLPILTSPDPRPSAPPTRVSCNSREPSTARLLPVERALFHWCAQQAARHQLAPDAAHTSRGHRRLLRALGAVVARAPRSQRPAVARCAADGRRLVMARSGAGIEQLMEALAAEAPPPPHAGAPDDRAWLERVVSSLRDVAPPAPLSQPVSASLPSPDDVRLEAVLTLLPDGAGA